MEIKRNPLTHIPLNQPKNGQLVQPLLNISKASTPVRTRVVGGTAQPNSTPISINKIVGNIHKSPNNKQNYRSNVQRTEINSKNSGIMNEGQNKINLSPIYALNKRLHEGPKFQSRKSMTPENHKHNQDYEGYQRRSKGDKKFNTQTSLNDSKSMVNYNSTTNLRGSNCFKALIQNRSKSPSRFQGSSGSKMMHKKEGTPLLKESMSSNQLFTSIGLDSKGKLAESRSFDQLRHFSNNRLESSEVKCMNNDGKKAKYRVICNEDGQNGQRYYCSKCTIPLVQQGFIVQQIAKDVVKDCYQHPEISRLKECRSRLESVRKNTQCILIQIKDKQDQELSRLDQYYEIVFDYLERQRKGQKRKISQYYSQKKADPSAYSRQISGYIEGIDQMTQNLNAQPFRLSEIEEILESQVNFVNPRDLGIFEQNIQFLADRFIRVFQQTLKIPMGLPKNLNLLQSRGQSSSNSRNHPMRFSFEKLISANNKQTKKRQMMNPLLEVEEEDYQQNDGVEPQHQEHTAFRDLFPEEEEEQLNTDIYSPTFKNI